MATTTYNHCQIGVVDATGNVDVVYPQNTGDDVQISRTNNSQIPSDVSTSQDLADKLGSLAFKSALSVSNFATGVVTTATNITSAGYLADARAIATLTNQVTELSSNVGLNETQSMQLETLYNKLVKPNGQFLFYTGSNGGYRDSRFISQLSTFSKDVKPGTSLTVQFSTDCYGILIHYGLRYPTITGKGSIQSLTQFTAGTYFPRPENIFNAKAGDIITFVVDTGWVGFMGFSCSIDTSYFV